jgi:hypothetical protein
MMDALSFKKGSITHDRSLFMSGKYRQVFWRDLSAVNIYRKMIEVAMPEIVRVESMLPRKSVFFTNENNKSFGRTTSMALSVESDCEPLENVKVLSSTLVILYLAGNPLSSFSLWAARIDGLG